MHPLNLIRKLIQPEECRRQYSALGLERAPRFAGAGAGAGFSSPPPWTPAALGADGIYMRIDDATAASWAANIGTCTVAQANAAKQMAVVANSFGALPGLKGSGSGTQLMVSSNFAAAIAQPYVVLWAYKGIDQTSRVMVGASDLAPSIRGWRLNAGGTVFYNGSSLASSNAPDANPYIWTAIANGASSKLYLDSTEIASGNAGAGTMENFAVGNTFLNAPIGTFGDILIIKGTSASDAGIVAKAKEYLTERHCRHGIVVCEGDSLSNGGTYEISWPCQMLLTSNYRVYNTAVWGAYVQAGGFASMIDRGATDVDPLLSQPQPWNVAVLWGGTNDMCPGARTPAQIYADIETWCAARRTAGWRKIVVCTLTYRADVDPVTWSPVVDQINALIRANAGGAADAIADVGAITELQDPTNVTHFLADKLHLQPASYQTLVAPLIKDTIATVTP